MSTLDDDTQEPVGGDQERAGTPEPKGRRLSFGKVRRDLTEDELGSSGVQKMLLDEIDRLDRIEEELRFTSINYHETSAALAVTEEKIRTHRAFDVISTGGVAAGSLLFGVAFSLQGNEKVFWVLIVLSIIIVAVGIVAKVVRA